MNDTSPHRIVLVAAVSDNGIIGTEGTLPWHLPEDLKHFKNETMGHPVVMGRKTFDEVGKPLPGRPNIVLTRNTDWSHDNVQVTDTIDHAITLAQQHNPHICIIGGGEVYRLAMPHATDLVITHVHTTVEGDTTFPTIDPAQWVIHEQSDHPPTDDRAIGFTIARYRRA